MLGQKKKKIMISLYLSYWVTNDIFRCLTFNLIFFLKGLAITFVSDETDAKILNEVQDRFEVDISELPEEIDLSTYIEGR